MSDTLAPKWIVELEEDPDTGDLLMPIPPEVLALQGWDIGDVLTWDVNETTGEISLSKKPTNLDSVDPL